METSQAEVTSLKISTFQSHFFLGGFVLATYIRNARFFSYDSNFLYNDIYAGNISIWNFEISKRRLNFFLHFRTLVMWSSPQQTSSVVEKGRRLHDGVI